MEQALIYIWKKLHFLKYHNQDKDIQLQLQVLIDIKLENDLIYIFGGFDGNKWLNDLYVLDVGLLENRTI